MSLFVRPHSLIAFCAFLSPFVCLSFGLALEYSACLPHVLSEQLCLLLPLLPPSFPLFFVVLPALHTSCPVSALSLASLCFSFVLKLAFGEVKIYYLLTMKNEKRKNPSRFSFIFAVEQFKLKTKQSFILKHTML